jgi:hypothetical protein
MLDAPSNRETYWFSVPEPGNPEKDRFIGILMGLRVLAVQRFTGYQSWITTWHSVAGNRKLTITILRRVINLAS